jgi:hypothetical protein
MAYPFVPWHIHSQCVMQGIAQFAKDSDFILWWHRLYSDRVPLPFVGGELPNPRKCLLNQAVQASPDHRADRPPQCCLRKSSQSSSSSSKSQEESACSTRGCHGLSKRYILCPRSHHRHPRVGGTSALCSRKDLEFCKYFNCQLCSTSVTSIS